MTSPPLREPVMRGRRLQPDEVVAIIRAYRAGATLAELATCHEIKRQSVAALLRRSGVPARPRRLPTDQDVARAIELYSLGWSLTKIGKDLAFDAKTIWRHLYNRVPMRQPWDRPSAEA